MSNIVIIQGHPDPSEDRLCRALAKAYRDGALSAGHSVEMVDPAAIDFPLLRSQQDWKSGLDGTPDSLRLAQRHIVNAEHLLIVYPLWLGTMPARLKAFFEQVFRPGVALSTVSGNKGPLLTGKSARIVITMGMPAMAYRWFFLSHSLKNLERNILRFVGIKPVRSTLFGMVEDANRSKIRKWLDKMQALGKAAR